MVLDEVEEENEGERRDDEAEPGRFAGKVAPKKHRPAHNVQGNQTPKQAKADEEQTPQVKGWRTCLEGESSFRAED